MRAFKVIDMHDEAQWECPPEEIDALTGSIHECFVRATEHYNLRCPMEADIKVGNNWAETH